MQTKYSGASCFANFFVISLIPILFFVAMILGYLHIIPLNVPIHSLGVIGFILFIFLLFIKHNANYAVCKMRSSHKNLENALNLELQKNSLVIDDKTKSVLKIDNFLKKYFSDVRNNNFVSVASSIFPMLGILGTFVAIALSMPNFAVGSTKELDSEISLLLSGVGSAFFASIYGILLSLIWTYFEKRGLSKVDTFFQEIQNEYQDSIWLDEELLIYQYAQYDINKKFNLDFVKDLNEHHLASYERIMSTTTKNFQELASKLSHLSGELQETLKEMNISTNALNAQNHIDKALVDFTLATKSFERNSKIFTAQLDNSLNRTFDKIDTEIGEIVIKLADFATHVSLESREVQDSIAKYHYMVANHLKVQ
ncbi:MotA/TolQ/ExbB proton channel family protein [Sulfurimonas sp.]